MSEAKFEVKDTARAVQVAKEPIKLGTSGVELLGNVTVDYGQLQARFSVKKGKNGSLFVGEPGRANNGNFYPDARTTSDEAKRQLDSVVLDAWASVTEGDKAKPAAESKK